jgi:stage II sporulation protein D
MPRRLTATALAATVAAGAAAVPAEGATRFVLRGAGFGHGVGMSQYGALGQAQAGRTYRQILGHYYSGTALGALNRSVTVRVLLQSRGTVAFTGATRAGDRELDPERTYTAVPEGAGVVLRGPEDRPLGKASGALRVDSDEGPVTVVGGEHAGAYRGSLVLAPSGGALQVVNHVELEAYVRGVVAGESPSGWPAEALKAQAVAARTYAITTSKNGGTFDHYADTRSQVYGGVALERATTDAAIAATKGQVVTQFGRPVVTYFFSTSGGRTENVEFGFPGGTPQPHLKSVTDPWDRVSPRHRWGPTSMTMGQAANRLRGLVRGRFAGVGVVRRGVSPRVVSAEVIGSAGRTPVSGPALRARFGLYDTWATFAAITTKGRFRPAPAGTGGVPIGSAAFKQATQGVVFGRIVGPRRGATVRVQRLEATTWRTVARTRLAADARYRSAVSEPGRYRVLVDGLPGPAITLRD